MPKIRKIDPLIIALMVINTVVFLIENTNYDKIVSWGASNYDLIIHEGQFYRLVTSMFLHGSFIHLLSNMYSLYILSDLLLRESSKVKYLIIYFSSGILGGFISICVSHLIGLNTFSIGASGAIMGLLGANIVQLIKLRKQGLVNQSLIVNLAIVALINVVPIHQGIDYSAHICGMIVGAVTAFLLSDKNNKFKNLIRKTPFSRR